MPLSRSLLRSQTPWPPSTDRPDAGLVLITRDRDLTGHIRALAEAVGRSLVVLPRAVGAAVSEAGLVLLGTDALAEAPRQRRGLIVVARGGDSVLNDEIWRRALALGAENVTVLPEGDGWLLARMATTDRGRGPRAPVIAVLGGAGGAGASTLAACLVTVAVRWGYRSVLVDADPLGGGLDLAFGAEERPGLRWPDLPVGPGALTAQLLRRSLPAPDDVLLLSCARTPGWRLPAELIEPVLEAATQLGQLVVVDLPRYVGDAEQRVLRAAKLTLIVVPAQVRASAAASYLVGLIQPQVDDLRVVVRRGTRDALSAADVARSLELPLAGQLSSEPRIAAALDAGQGCRFGPRGPTRDLCRRVLTDVLESA